MSENTQPNNLSPNQIKAIEALLSNPSVEKAAQAVGVDKSTLFRWLRDGGFKEAYAEARKTLLESTLTGLQAISTEAVEALHAELTNATAKPSERIAAAKAILEFSLKGVDAIETEKRLAAIEEAFTALREARK